MAAVARNARTQIGLLRTSVAQSCAARRQQSAARSIHTPPALAGSAPSPASHATANADLMGFAYPAWSRAGFLTDAFSGHIGRAYATGAGKDGADEVTGAAKTSGAAPSDAIGEEMRVDTMVRDELEEPAPGLKEKAKQAARAVGEKVKDTGKSIKDAASSDGVAQVGDTVEGAGETIEEKSADRKTLGKEDVVTS